jgi:hypothetical protein
MKSIRLSLTLLAATSLSAVRAQDLTATITVDPGTNTATYGFTVQGPANGWCFPAASLRLLPDLQFPGVLGSLQIDPLLMFALPMLPLDPFGSGGLQFQVPLPLATQLPLMLQAAVIDPANNQIAFCDVGVVMPCFQPANPNLPAVALSTAYNDGNLTVTFATGPANANVTILVNGGQKAQAFLILGPNGQGTNTLPVPGGMERGDTVTVLVNGVPVTNYVH